MRPLLKSVLLWLLAVALPVQALAAAGMRHCGASHERMRVAVAATASPHDHAVGAHHAHAVDHVNSGHDAANDHPVSAEARSSCSACATCCFALALPVAGVQASARPPDGFAPAPPAVSVPPFVTGGLDRPPRILLA